MAGFRRLIEAVWRLVRYDALLPREAISHYPPALQALSRLLLVFAGPQSRLGRPGERLALALETLGPVAIKLGQLLSTRADIFGAAFAVDLSLLTDRLSPFPTACSPGSMTLLLQPPWRRPIRPGCWMAAMWR